MEHNNYIVDNTKEIRFMLLNEDAKAPNREHDTDSGYDLYISEDVELLPWETLIIKTGVAIKLPPGLEAQVRPRSGVTSKTKLRVQLGTIDNEYTGEIGIIVDNNSDEIVALNKGYKLAQLVPSFIPLTKIKKVKSFEHGTRGDKGFGSSGV